MNATTSKASFASTTSSLTPATSRRPSAKGDADQSNLNELKETLISSSVSSKNVNRTTEHIEKLQDQADRYTRKIELQRRHVSDLDKQIADMNEKIAEQRKKAGGYNGTRDNHAQIQKQVKTLENRLDKAMQKYNAAVSLNKDLRNKINDLRRERLVFDGIFKKLERELAEKKREMAQIIEVSNKAYEARDAAVSEMARLKIQADKEQTAFAAEWRDLSRNIEHDRKMRELGKLKRDGDSLDPKATVAACLEEETKLRKKVIKGNWSIAKDKAHQQVSMEKVQSYGEAFAKIQEATGISDIDELVERFVRAEDENFRLFKYVDELNQEIARMEEQVSGIETEIEVCKRLQGGSQEDKQDRKQVLREMESKLHETESNALALEVKYQGALSTVSALKNGVAAIFTKLGCDTTSARELLGGEGVTEENIMQHLGLVEQRTNEILQMYAASQVALIGGEVHPGMALAVLGQGPHIPLGSGQVYVEPPSTADEVIESDEDDDDELDYRPMTRSELQGKASRVIAKKESAFLEKQKKKGKQILGTVPDNMSH